MASSSLLETPHGLDSLPRYTRDPETTSIRSSAPSYISEAPSYHSNHTSQPRRLPRSLTSPPNSLPTSRHAPGFNRSSSISNVQHHAYNISEWSCATNGPRARHYQAVANRRVNDPHPSSLSIIRTDPPNSAVQPLGTVDEEAAAAAAKTPHSGSDEAPNQPCSPSKTPRS